MFAEAVEPEGGEHGGAAGEQDDGHGGAAGLVDLRQEAVEDAVQGGVAGERVEQSAHGDTGHGAGGPVAPGEGKAGEGQGEDRDAQKGIGVDKQAGKEDPEQGRGLEAVFAQDVVGDFLAPGEGLGGAHPADGLASVLHGGKDLQGAGGRGHQPEGAAGYGETAVANEHPGPQACGGEGEEDGDLMMAAEPGNAEGEAAEGGRAERLGGAGGAEQTQEDERNPGGAVEHLGPVQAAKQAGEWEGNAAQDGGPAPAAEFAGQAVSEHRHEQVGEDVVPVEDFRAEVAVAERHQEQEPVQRVGGAGLGLADEGLAAVVVGIPESDAAGLPFAGLELEPGENLVDVILAAEPGKLIGEDELPVDAEDDGDQKQGGGPPAQVGLVDGGRRLTHRK
ncbi:MAG: hypothetical protein ACK5XD_03905 [Acidobacteriota bacterium]